MRKKQLLFVINTLGRAGAETAMIALLEQLKDTYDIDLYVVLEQGEMVHDLPKEIRLINKEYSDSSVLSAEGQKKLYKVTLKKMLAYASFVRNFPYLIANAFDMLKSGKGLQKDKLLWRIVSDGSARTRKKYDLAISYLEGGAAYYVRDHVNAKKKAGFIHIDYTQAGYTRKLDKDCYVGFDRIFTVSDEVREHFLSVYPELADKTKIFHNLLNISLIQKRSQENLEEPSFAIAEKENAPKLVTVGRLNPQKGYDVAIQALHILHEKYQHKAHWYVLGDGPEYKSLCDIIEREGMQQYFHLLGAKDNPYPYYKNADIYMHATRFEGKSIAIQEAQILGCTIIASDCSGNREQIISRQDGLLCEFSKEGIAKAIAEVLEDPAKAKQYAQEAAKKQINHLEELSLIEELLAEK